MNKIYNPSEEEIKKLKEKIAQLQLSNKFRQKHIDTLKAEIDKMEKENAEKEFIQSAIKMAELIANKSSKIIFIT